MSSSTSENGLHLLRASVSSSLALLSQFESSISARSPTNAPAPLQSPSSQPDPLDKIHTCATLIRAHTTKLSLLIITKPFTPSAVTKVLHELTLGPLPGLMSAVESCNEIFWGSTFREEVKSMARTLLRELRTLMGEIPLEERSPVLENKTGAASKDSLSCTGVVWEACDALIQLREEGIAGVVTQKAQEYHDMLEDAIAELQEWSNDVEEDDDDDDNDQNKLEFESNGAGGSSENDLEDLLQPSTTLSQGSAELRSQLELSLKKLSLVKMLYKAIIKRRLRCYPLPKPAESKDRQAMDDILRLESLMGVLKAVPEETDELASTFYELDTGRAREQLSLCLNLAENAAELSRQGWNSTSVSADEFGEWIKKWIVLIKKE